MGDPRDNDAGVAVQRLVSAAESASAEGALAEFALTYRDWIVEHHDLPGSRAERIEKTHLLLYAMTSASTLAEAITLLGRFRRLVWNDRSLSLRDDGAFVTLILEQPFRPGLTGLVSDLWSLSFLLTELGFLIGGPVDGVTGAIRQECGLSPSTVALLFDRPLAFRAAALALEIPRHHLQRPIVARSEQVPEFLQRLVPQTIGPRQSPPDFGRFVTGIVRADALQREGGPLNLTAVAARLGIGVATLRRRLVDAGTTFREIRQRILDETADCWLAEGLSIDTIAERLGYSDPFAFRRAFHRTHGCSPTAYRSAMAQGQIGQDSEDAVRTR